MSIAERLMIRAARKRDARAAERLERALFNQKVSVVLQRRRRQREQMADDTDRTWPPRFIAQAARVRR